MSILCQLFRFLAKRSSLIFGGLSLIQISIFAEILPVKTYTASDGLPRDAVLKVRQDQRGFMWFCTSEGLVRFDGYQFKLYTKEDGLPERRVTDFLQARDGTYWLGTDRGLVRFDPNGQRSNATSSRPMFTDISMEHPPVQPRRGIQVNVLYEDPQGTLWVGMNDGLNKLVSENGHTFLRRIHLPFQSRENFQVVRAVLRDRRGNLWVGAEYSSHGTYHSLYQLKPTGEVNHYQYTLGPIYALLEDRKGLIWGGLNSQTGALCQLSENPNERLSPFARCYGKKEGLPNTWINSLLQARDGTIWLSTEKGTVRFNSNTVGQALGFQSFLAKNGICDANGRDVFEDREGNLWISSECGVTKLVKNGFIRYSSDDGLSGMQVHTIFNDRAKNLIVATNDERDMTLQVFDGQRFTALKANTPPNTNHGWGWGQIVVNSRAGDWWFPTEQGILYRFRNITNVRQLTSAKPQAYTAKEGFTDKMVWKMYEDRRGDLWISTSYEDKLLRWNRETDSFTQFSASSDNPNLAPRPHSYAEEADGTLWMGGSDGKQSYLLRYRNGEMKSFGAESGMPAQEARVELFIDSKGRMWVGTRTLGLGRIDDLKTESLQIRWYNRSHGLSSNVVESLIEDQFGRIYIGNMRGVDCLTPETGQMRYYTTADGLPRDHIYVSGRDAQNSLWFGSPFGVARFIPEAPQPNQPPTIFLSAVRVAGIAQPVSEIGELSLPVLELNASQTNVTLEFLSPSATADLHLRYQYKLEGERDWSVPTEQRIVDFANLAAGSYRFLVRAINADGIVSSIPASVSFRIAPPVYRRWWFVTFSLLAMGGLVYAAYHYRVRQLLALERMRMRIATDLHDEVGSSLSQIAILSEVARQRLQPELAHTTTTAKEPLEKVAVTSREALDAMSDLVWAINPQRDQLSDLSQRMRRFASDTLSAKNIVLRFHAPDTEISLDAEVRRQVFLIFKEAINNIARHADATVVEVEFTMADHHLSLQIKDNGHGFVETNPVPGQSGGNGLASMRRRAEELGGILQMQSDHGNGTVVRLEAPLSPRRKK